MWSLGCILSDMLTSLQPIKDDNSSSSVICRRSSFKGDSCFPLSPKYKGDEISKEDQLIKILQMLPKLQDDDTSFMADQVAKANIMNLNVSKSQKLPEKFNFLQDSQYNQLFTILINLLQFNPDKRWSAKQCLKMPIFNKYRSKRERDAPSKI